MAKDAKAANGSKEKFVRLATKRVSNAIKAIQLVGNLSNRSVYDYEPAQVTKIFSVLQSEVDTAKTKFGTKQKAHSAFSLE